MPAKASGNQASCQRGRCQRPGRGSSNSRSCWELDRASPASRSSPRASPSVPSNRQRTAISAAAPSRAGPAQTSSQPAARAPPPIFEDVQVDPVGMRKLGPRVGPRARQHPLRIAQPVAKRVEVVDAHDEGRERSAPLGPRASSGESPASRSSPAPARPADPGSSRVFKARTE